MILISSRCRKLITFGCSLFPFLFFDGIVLEKEQKRDQLFPVMTFVTKRLFAAEKFVNYSPNNLSLPASADE
jgi:hypothetical protein